MVCFHINSTKFASSKLASPNIFPSPRVFAGIPRAAIASCAPGIWDSSEAIFAGILTKEKLPWNYFTYFNADPDVTI